MSKITNSKPDIVRTPLQDPTPNPNSGATKPPKPPTSDKPVKNN